MSVFDATSLSDLEIVGRLALGTGLGAMIGLEREIDGHDAGIRTHALLALGSALFGVASVGGFAAFISERATSNVQVDVTRIASYVAAGVGFLGGGAILKQTHRVRGLTTAASLWSCAAVGLCAGIGFWVAAVAATIISLVMLVLDRPMQRIMKRHTKRTVVVVFEGRIDRAAVTETLLADATRVEITADDESTTITLKGVADRAVPAIIRNLGSVGTLVDSTVS